MGSVVKVKVKNTAVICLIVLSLLLWTITKTHEAFAYKETATSCQDGYDKVYSDAICDLQSYHGHGLVVRLVWA